MILFLISSRNWNSSVPLLTEHTLCWCMNAYIFLHLNTAHTHWWEWEPACWELLRDACLALARLHWGHRNWAGSKALSFAGRLSLQRALWLQDSIKWSLKKGYWDFRTQPLSFGHYVSNQGSFLFDFLCVISSQQIHFIIAIQESAIGQKSNHLISCCWAHWAYTLLVCKCQIILTRFISRLGIQQLDIIIVSSFWKYVGPK